MERTLPTLLSTCILIFLFTSKLVFADHPSVGLTTGNASAINTTSAETLSKGQWTFSVNTEVTDNNVISDRRLIANAQANEDSDVHSISTVQQLSINFAAGITDNFTLAAQLPYVKRTNIEEAEDEDGEIEIKQLGNSEGIGDARLFGQYRFLQNDLNKTSAAFIAGIKIPTGETNEEAPEEKLDAELQPGSGSWDPFIGLAFSKRWDKWSFDSNATYQLATEGTQDTDLGDFVGLNTAFSYRLNSEHQHSDHSHIDLQWDLIFEINGEWREKEDVDRDTNDDSGGLLVFASPGVRLSTNNGLSASLAAGVPIIEDLNGLQTKPEYRVNANISIAF